MQSAAYTGFFQIKTPSGITGRNYCFAKSRFPARLSRPRALAKSYAQQRSVEGFHNPCSRKIRNERRCRCRCRCLVVVVRNPPIAERLTAFRLLHIRGTLLPLSRNRYSRVFENRTPLVGAIVTFSARSCYPLRRCYKRRGLSKLWHPRFRTIHGEIPDKVRFAFKI